MGVVHAEMDWHRGHHSGHYLQIYELARCRSHTESAGIHDVVPGRLALPRQSTGVIERILHTGAGPGCIQLCSAINKHMNKHILAACLLFSAWASAAEPGVTYPIKVTRVIDGDTVAFEATWLPDPLKKELSIRVYGVDTPEKGFRAKCESEAQRGEAASAFTRARVSGAHDIKMVLLGWDKYGGRVLGDVILDGQSLRQSLIDQGHAREYYGEAKKSWCE